MQSHLVLFVVLLLSLSARFVLAEEKTPATTEPATTAPSGGVIAATDKDAISTHLNNEVTIEGMVTDAKWSSSGKVFVIKFKGTESSQFQAAVFSKNKEAMEKAFDGDLTKGLEGAKLQVKGKLQTFREHPEIVIDKPEQLTIVEKPIAK